MITKLISENINDFLKRKESSEIIKGLFKGTLLENSDPNEYFYLEINTVFAFNEEIEHHLRRYKITYNKINNNRYILYSTLMNFINYLIMLGWKSSEIKYFLNDNLTKNL